jgi:predicted dienelactone hydrolase
LIVGLLLHQGFYPHNIATETINLKRDRDHALVGRLYIPDQTKTPYPTIILWHGVSSSKEMMEPLAIELARQGIAALAFDAGGFGESSARPLSAAENLQDARVVFDYVKQHPERFDHVWAWVVIPWEPLQQSPLAGKQQIQILQIQKQQIQINSA